MSDKSYKKCSKCNIGYNQDYHKDFSYTCSNEVEKQRRIFAKSGKHFCFNCLASEYELNCQYCHKRINSKDELAYWGGGILSIDGDYDYCKADDRVFTCWSCDEKIREKMKSGVKPSWHSGWGSILFPEHHIRKCRIAGCSQKPYYECVDLCLPHSKSCKGGKIKPNGGRCNAAMGVDEGDICEFCQNQIETYQQQKDGLENESNREGERYQQAIQGAQSWWDSLSNEEKQREIRSLEALLPTQIKNFWNHRGYKTNGNETRGNAKFSHHDTFENGKLHQSDSTRVPWAIVDEFYEKGGRNGSRTIRKDNLPASNSTSPSPQLITNSNGKNDNSVSSSNSPQPNSEPNLSLEIKVVNNNNNQLQPKPGQQENNQTLVISLENIKKIILVGDNLVVEFNQGKNSQVVDSEQVYNNQILKKVKSYLQTNHLSSVCNQELVNLLSQKNTDESPNSSTLSSQIPWMAVLSVSGILITIGLVFLIVKVKRSPSKKK